MDEKEVMLDFSIIVVFLASCIMALAVLGIVFLIEDFFSILASEGLNLWCVTTLFLSVGFGGLVVFLAHIISYEGSDIIEVMKKKRRKRREEKEFEKLRKSLRNF